MAAPELVHLHVHSQYSMLDGAIRLKGLVERVKALGMGAVALTDHGNMFAAVQLHKTCKEVGGVKPILGCEVNLTPGDRKDASDRSARHLVLLAASDVGYRNLVQIVSRGWVDVPAVTSGPPLPPRIDFEVLRAHSAGLVGLSGCMAGHLAQEVLLRGEGAGRAAMANLRDSFAPGHFFVELQDHGLPEQKPLAEILVQLARDLSLPLVATNDCHYLTREDAPAQLALQCIGSGRLLEEMERAHHGSHEMWVKTPAEMAERFADVPEALANTLRVAEMTAGQCSPFSKPKLPRFKTPDGSSEEDHLRALSRRRLDERFAEAAALGRSVDEEHYRRRLEWELEVIVQMGFAGYFLIVQDFIVWAKERGIPVGPGRGSGAGSIVAWSLKITDLDPIPYGLLFERFLNPERVSMPDFDIDFCMDRRDEVIAYVRERYGHESVGQIATFHLLKSRSVVRDVGRVMKMTPQDAGAIASLVPEPVQGKSVPIATAMEQEPKLKQRYDEDPQIKTLLDTAMKLEDLARHAGMHAAGVVISEGALWDHVPVFCPEPGALVTQYHKDDVEAAGLVKFDFLGLKTLTVIDVCQRLIRRRPGADGEFRIEAIPMDDKATFALLSSGETTNVFQLESSGMQSLFKQLKPDCFEDIVAAVALYRPGPLGSGMVEDFVQRKHGRIKVAYPHPCLEKILKETYGVIVYQEQVMQAAQEMAGYTLGGADLLRRAMGKKKAEEMAKQKATFIEGAVQKKYAAEDAQRVFELIDFFAGYGFNKCVIGDTRVVDARTGERTTVRALFDRRHERRGFTVHALGDDWKLRPRAVTDVVWNGRKPVFEVVTQQGKRITATANHPFRTLDGWTVLGDLRPGDAIAAARELPVATKTTWPRHEVIGLAGLLSEGNTCHPSCLYFYGNEPRLVNDFAAAISAFPQTVARVYPRSNGKLEVCVSTGRGSGVGERWSGGEVVDGNVALEARLPARSGAFEWAGRLGLLGKKATAKIIPDAVFTLRDCDVELFLGRLWAGDGFFASKALAVPFYATSSRALAEGVQTLLLRLGILSGVHEKTFKYRGTERPGYTVHLLGETSIEEFARRVAPHAVGRDAQIALLRSHLQRTERGRTSKDTIPAEVRKWLDDERRRAGLTWREVEERSGLSVREMYGNGSARKRGFRRATIGEFALFFASERLSALARGHVFWDRVVSIESRGEQDTFDLTVEEDHNFVAEGLVVHNSHSAAYALITYQTAYLKAHYPVEFICATLTADKDKIDKVVRTVAEARAMGITVLPPDVNESEIDFSVVYAKAPDESVKRKKDQPVSAGGKLRDPMHPQIRFGLGGVKGIGESALEAIFEVRKDEPFLEVFDFCDRVDLRRVNKAVVEALTQCGAFDAVHKALGVPGRAPAFAAIDAAIERGKKASADRASGQTSLFGLLDASPGGGASAGPRKAVPLTAFPRAEPWDTRELLAREKTALGFYVSGHPLDRYASELRRFSNATTESCAAMQEGSKVVIGGSVEGYRERTTKTGRKIAFFSLEDPHGRVEVIVRPQALDKEEIVTVLTGGDPVLVTGTLQFEMDRGGGGGGGGGAGGGAGGGEDGAMDAAPEPKIILEEVAPLAQSLRQKTKSVRVKLMVEKLRGNQLHELRATLAANPGPCPVSIEIGSTERWMVQMPTTGLSVEPSDALLSALEKLFGEKVCELR